VNTILVDFRAFDTLGEITVLGASAIGVYSLVKLRTRGKPSSLPEGPQLEKRAAVPPPERGEGREA